MGSPTDPDPGPLVEVVPGRIWTTSRPVRFSGVWLWARSPVVRLADGALWLHSPPPPVPALREALEALGPVRWLVVPNRFHHLAMPECARAWPEATVIGPRSACARNPELRLDLELGDPEVARRIPEIEPYPLDGVPFLDETLFFHRPTGTLIGADLVLRPDEDDHWSWRLAARALRRYGKVKVPPDVRLRTGRDPATARSLRAVLDLPIQRLLVAHAQPIEDRPAERLAAAWRHVLQ